MTTYAYLSAARQLLAVWAVGIGQRAEVVADVDHLPAQHADGLCYRLTRLSECLWDTYVRPVSAADRDDPEELWRRQEARDSFELVFAGLYLPNFPSDDGDLEMTGVPVEDYAHALGRLLSSIDDRELTEAVAAEIGREMRAVESAERGDLSGRAAQAVVLDRLDISPAQVAAADRMLWESPLGSAGLLTSVDPAAACVAAAHWLAAAATVASEVSGVATGKLFGTAERGAATVPGIVTHGVLADHRSPHDVVYGLLRRAIAAKEGRRPDHPDPSPHRTTPLDPMRPTRDLLEHLLDGIRTCLVVLAQHVDQQTGAHPDPALEQFVVGVRQAATTRHERLA